MTIPEDAEWLTRHQVATKFQVSPLTIKRWGDDGVLTAYRVGEGTVRYSREEVEKLAKPIEHTAAE